MNIIKKLIKSVLPEKVFLRVQALDHFFNGEREIRLVDILCKAGKTTIDAGANIGTYSYFFQKYSGAVVAYEPNPELAGRLQRVLPNVVVRNVALSDHPDKVTLRIPVAEDGTQNHELASIAQTFDGKVVDYCVDAVTIDSEGLQNIGLIKVDVEQHEREVLKGALETIRRCRPNIMTETSPLKYDVDLSSAFEFLLREGYVGWFFFAGKWQPLTTLDPSVHLKPEQFGNPDAFIGNNLLFFPQESNLAMAGPRI